MERYQLRVIIEKEELDGKIEQLDSFLRSPAASCSIDGDERERLARQMTAMNEYSRILGERIGAFG